MEAGTFLAILIGTIMGGVLVLLPLGNFLISCAICLVSIFGFISSLFIPNTQIENLSVVLRYNFLYETVRVINYSRKHRDIFFCTLGISWFWLVGSVFLSEFPVLAKDILHANEHVVTFFMATFSIGIAIGSLLCNRVSKGHINATYVQLGAIGMTLFILDLCFAASSVSKLTPVRLTTLNEFLHTVSGLRIGFDLIFIAICGGLYTVPLYAMLQTRSELSHRARVIASNNVINALFMVIAAIASIVMFKMGYTVIHVFSLIAILNALVAFLIWKVRQ